MEIRDAHLVLVGAGFTFERGLDSEERAAIEREFKFRFPPDLSEFLSLGVPISNNFCNWRGLDRSTIRMRLNWPLEGIQFDIEQNQFWMDKWGPKPADIAEAMGVAKMQVEAAPTLIPICSHRYLPALPAEAGNPVFSVHQTDIIHYGVDLIDYLKNEFSYYFKCNRFENPTNPKRVELWSELVKLNEG